MLLEAKIISICYCYCYSVPNFCYIIFLVNFYTQICLQLTVVKRLKCGYNPSPSLNLRETMSVYFVMCNVNGKYRASIFFGHDPASS
jgi:hypothetical protein